MGETTDLAQQQYYSCSLVTQNQTKKMLQVAPRCTLKCLKSLDKLSMLIGLRSLSELLSRLSGWTCTNGKKVERKQAIFLKATKYHNYWVKGQWCDVLAIVLSTKWVWHMYPPPSGLKCGIPETTAMFKWSGVHLISLFSLSNELPYYFLLHCCSVVIYWQKYFFKCARCWHVANPSLSVLSANLGLGSDTPIFKPY